MGGFVALQREEWFVTCDEELRMPGLGEGKEIVVVGIGGDLNLREFLDDDGQVAKVVHETSGKGRGETGANFRIPGDAGDLVELLKAGDEIEFAGAP